MTAPIFPPVNPANGALPAATEARYAKPSDLTKANVGLGNVSNLAPADLPVSTAAQTALNLKADRANATLTGSATAVNLAVSGVMTVPDQPANDNSSEAANTRYVDSRVATYANAATGSDFRVRCIGGVQPVRSTLTSRTDITFVYLMMGEPVKGGAYAIQGDGWEQEQW